MDGEMKVILGTGLFFLGLLMLYIFSWNSINNRVDNAKTKSELREACAGISIQNAPVRCLELGK